MKTAVVGIGQMGRRHLQAVLDTGLELVGICDRSEEALRQAGEQFNLSASQQFNELESLLANARPEFLIISTTAPSHSPFTCAAAESGVKYILCEKPMATSLADCDRMIEACKSNGVRLSINHPIRFIEFHQKIKRLVHSAEFGGLSSVTIVAGNLGLAMNGSHYFEMFRYLTGEPAAEVTAWFSETTFPNPRGPEFEDRAGSVRAVNSKGQRLYMEIGPDQGHGIKIVYAGPYGQLVFDQLTGSLHLSVREEQYRDLPGTRYAMPAVETTDSLPPINFDTLLPEVFRELLAGGEATSGEDARLAVAALVAAYVSHENGHLPVRLDQKLPLERAFPWA